LVDVKKGKMRTDRYIKRPAKTHIKTHTGGAQTTIQTDTQYQSDTQYTHLHSGQLKDRQRADKTAGRQIDTQTDR